MRDHDAGGLNLSNLGGGFGGNFVGIKTAGDGARCKCHHTVAEVRAGGQRGQGLRTKNGIAIREHDMATHAQLRDCFRQLHGVGKRRAIRHQRRRSDNAARVGLDDGPVHARSVAKIIGIDDQTPHAASLAGTRSRAQARPLAVECLNLSTRRSTEGSGAVSRPHGATTAPRARLPFLDGFHILVEARFARIPLHRVPIGAIL